MGLISGTKGQLLRVTTFTSSGTWTKQNDVGMVLVKVTGGGGGGPAVNGATDYGGGGGGYSEKIIFESSLGATETVTVGAGGSAGAANSGSGGPGGTSLFGSHCQATGGSNNGSGGVGSGGDINLTGCFGSSPNYTDQIGGNGGSSPTINGAGVGIAVSPYSKPGNANSGSGGASSAQLAVSGAAGGSGLVIVYEYSK